MDPDNENIKTNESKTGDVSPIVDELINNQSDISQHAIDTEQIKQNETKNEFDQLKDKNGDSFDPDKHVTLKSGEPSVTPTGKLRLKSGRKKSTKSQVNPSSIGKSTTQNSRQPENLTENNNSEVTGRAAANLLFTVGMIIGGEEWLPIKNEEHGIDEQATMERAFSDYFIANNMEDLPAGFALTAAVGMYALSRFSQPKTKTRFTLFKAWVSNKFSKWRGKKPNAQPNLRNDRKREDDTRKETSTSVKS